jgi:hypothetical protein
MMAANILADPNFNTEEIVEQPTEVEDGEGDDSPSGDGTI